MQACTQTLLLLLSLIGVERTQMQTLQKSQDCKLSLNPSQLFECQAAILSDYVNRYSYFSDTVHTYVCLLKH
jgi:hypothetical protein